MRKITPHLWFNKEAVEAVEFYCSVFPNSRIINKLVIKDTPSGDCNLISFELNGQPFEAINSVPMFNFDEAISFIIPCNDQEAIDYYWEKLSTVPKSEQCGWVKVDLIKDI